MYIIILSLFYFLYLSDILCQIVDARNPLLFKCDDVVSDDDDYDDFPLPFLISAFLQSYF